MSPYATDHRKLLKDYQTHMIVQSLMSPQGDSVSIKFDSELDLQRIRQRLYHVLKSLGLGGDFKLSARNLTLEITKKPVTDMVIQTLEDK